MIIACPSCATRHHIPAGHNPVDGSVIKCTSCGHSWVEGSAIEIEDVACDTDLPSPVSGPNLANDAARIAKAAHEADLKRARERARKARTRNGWLALGALTALPVMAGAAFPGAIMQAVPATARLYQLVGVEADIYGLQLSGVTHQYVMMDKTPVLAVRGNVVNKTGRARKVPPLRFILTDSKNREVYAWTLAGVLRQKLAGGNSASFVTRITSPPKDAENLQIRFATASEIRHTGKSGS
ncbi:MAG TPA: hypothetical protein ENJ99_06645 [Rhizobiales bacterium]|nr:hypothetical protein [Hyphomicrobiales bacterium]